MIFAFGFKKIFGEGMVQGRTCVRFFLFFIPKYIPRYILTIKVNAREVVYTYSPKTAYYTKCTKK